MTETQSSTPSFESFGLVAPLMQGIRDAGFTRATPIQAQTLPIALAGRDVAGQAQTGTRKTAAFLLALFHRLLTVPAANRPRQNRCVSGRIVQSSAPGAGGSQPSRQRTARHRHRADARARGSD